MTAEHVGSTSSSVESSSDDRSKPSQRFMNRSRRTRVLLEDDLLGLGDQDLVAIIIDGDERSERAAIILATRYMGILVRSATDICGRLSHLGIRSLCGGAQCEEAFSSALTSNMRHAFGHRFFPVRSRGEIQLQGDPTDSGLTRQSACRRWYFRSDAKTSVPLAAWIFQELRQAGRSSDARRQWNKDRHLLQRMMVPPSVKTAIVNNIEDLREIARQTGRSDPFEQLNLDSDEQVIDRIADRMYIDACDCWFTDEPIGYSRVARYLGLIESREELTSNIVALIETLDLVMHRASDDDAAENGRPVEKEFHERYFGAARRVTRTILRTSIDESLIVDGEVEPQHDTEEQW